MKYSMLPLSFLAILLLLSTPALANETHVFFTRPSANDYGNSSSLPQLEPSLAIYENYTVTGDYADDVDVSYGGNEGEYDFAPVTGYLRLSAKPSTIFAGEGWVTIAVPFGVGAVEIVYYDNTAYNVPLVNGPLVTMEARATSLYGGIGPIKTLEQDVGAPGKVGKLVHQYFLPSFGGSLVGNETTLRLSAYGFDEIIIRRISFYTDSELDVNTKFIDGAKGRKSNVLYRDDQDEDDFYEAQADQS